MSWTEVFMFAGFVMAAYSIVANDAIQTLGTFLSSNSHRPWWILWFYACSILVAVMVYGWIVHYGDASWGRLAKFPEPEGGVTWVHAIPPVFILLLTRFGVPVSTTFLVLVVFAPTNLGAMLTKSLMGYGVAIVVGLLVYFSVSRLTERYFLSTHDRPPWLGWVVLQWCATAFLWSQWLIQDLANIFVYLPRSVSIELLAFAVALMLALHAYLFYRGGGQIQKIVASKTNVTDIRSATIVDLMYAFILLIFKQYSNVPMSTTWVFLGLLAGREIAMTILLRHRPLRETGKVVVGDGAKAMTGLAVSIALALGLPLIAGWTTTLAQKEDTTPALTGRAAGEGDDAPPPDVAFSSGAGLPDGTGDGTGKD